MPIAIQCGQCKAKYRVDDGAAGKQMRCTNCGNRISVPAAAGAGNESAKKSAPSGQDSNWAALLSRSEAPKPAAAPARARTPMSGVQKSSKAQAKPGAKRRLSPMAIGLGLSALLLVVMALIGTVMAALMVHSRPPVPVVVSSAPGSGGSNTIAPVPLKSNNIGSPPPVPPKPGNLPPPPMVADKSTPNPSVSPAAAAAAQGSSAGPADDDHSPEAKRWRKLVRKAQKQGLPMPPWPLPADQASPQPAPQPQPGNPLLAWISPSTGGPAPANFAPQAARPQEFPAIDVALRQLQSTVAEDCLSAMHDLQNMPNPPDSQKVRVGEALEPFLNSKDVRLQTAAMDTLAAWTGRDFVPALLTYLKPDEVPVCRAHAITVLGQLRDPRAIDPIAAMIQVGKASIIDLTPFGPAAEDAWLHLLQQQPNQEMVDGIAALAIKFGTAKSLEAFKAIANDPASPYQATASDVVEKFQSRTTRTGH